MFWNVLLVAGGMALLIKGADYLVDGASSIAQKFGISTLVIGLTVVAFGTSAPELAVNILSATAGSTDIALGNINGSNIANIFLVLGATALVTRVPVQSRTVIKEVPYMLLGGLMLVVVMLDVVLGDATESIISRTDGLVLLGFFFIFLYYLFLSSKDVPAAKIEKTKRPVWISAGLTVMGLVGLVLGGQFTVSGATGLAAGLGVSESLIALTIVAIGTSLPELVTAIVAAKKGETDLAVGGVVGSNIFNIFLVLGTTSVIAPIPASTTNLTDALVAFGAMIILLIAIHVGNGFLRDKNKDVSRNEGLLFITLYLVYIVFVVIRG